MGAFGGFLHKKGQQNAEKQTYSENGFLITGNDLSPLDEWAKGIYDSYHSNDIEAFGFKTNHIIRDIVDDPVFRDSKQPYLLGRSLLLGMTQYVGDVDLRKTIYGVIIRAMHSCLLKSRRDIEKGIEPYSKEKLVAVSKLLCVFYDLYNEFVIDVIHKKLPNSSADMVVYQFFGLQIVSYLSIHDNHYYN